jgi:hypothetical protein
VWLQLKRTAQKRSAATATPTQGHRSAAVNTTRLNVSGQFSASVIEEQLKAKDAMLQFKVRIYMFGDFGLAWFEQREFCTQTVTDSYVNAHNLPRVCSAIKCPPYSFPRTGVLVNWKRR